MNLSSFPEGQGIVFLDEFTRLEKDCFGIHAWDRNSILSHLSTKTSILLVSENNSIGYSLIYESPDEIEIFRIGITKSRQREGLGSKVLKFICTEFKKPVFLEVRGDNLSAISLYKKNAFHLVGKRKKYYSDGMEALLFRYGEDMESTNPDG